MVAEQAASTPRLQLEPRDTELLEREADRAADVVLPLLDGTATPAQRHNATSAQHDHALGALGGPLESAFGRDFSDVRIHRGPTAQHYAASQNALALTRGNDIYFAKGAFNPASRQSQHLLAHELAHVVQQSGGSQSQPGGMPSLSDQPGVVQRQDDVAALRARLQAVRARLRVLRAQTRASSDAYNNDALDRAQARSARDARSRLLQQRGARQTFPHHGVAAVVRRVVSATVSGSVVTLSIPMQLRYLTLSDDQARARGRRDIPNITAAIQSAWSIDISGGPYSGMQLRARPSVRLATRTAARNNNAFMIEVRGQDQAPSAADGTTGTISLANAHIDPTRVVVVAHELAHLFGFTDAYLAAGRNAAGQRVVGATVARPENPQRADLLGMVDPVVLQRWRSQGDITTAELARQSRAPQLWTQEATVVLEILGVLPPSRPRPAPGSADFDPADELEHQRQEGEARLRQARRRRAEINESIDWIGQAEEIMRLQQQERELMERLGRRSSSP